MRAARILTYNPVTQCATIGSNLEVGDYDLSTPATEVNPSNGMCRGSSTCQSPDVGGINGAGVGHDDGTMPASARNKLKCEDMATIRKRKVLMWTEVAKNEQDSLLERWLRDQIKPDTWDKIAQVFPQKVKCLPQQKWVLMTEDTKSLVPYRYQQYVITVKLTPDKHDKTRATFGTLPKTFPTLWVCCAHHDCMTVTKQILLHWQSFRDLKLMFAGWHRAEQLRLRSQQRVVTTVEESVLKMEMTGL